MPKNTANGQLSDNKYFFVENLNVNLINEIKTYFVQLFNRSTCRNFICIISKQIIYYINEIINVYYIFITVWVSRANDTFPEASLYQILNEVEFVGS